MIYWIIGIGLFLLLVGLIKYEAHIPTPKENVKSHYENEALWGRDKEMVDANGNSMYQDFNECMLRFREHIVSEYKRRM
jgi:hypothetical protein